MSEFTTVFEISFWSNRGLPSDVMGAIFGYILFIIGILSLLLNKNDFSVKRIMNPFIMVGFILSLTYSTIAVFGYLDIKNALNALYETGQYSVIEGTVHVLHMQPKGGHTKGDIIVIKDKQFEINYYSGRYGYNQTISNGGVLKEGVTARIYSYGSDIIRVDIKQ